VEAVWPYLGVIDMPIMSAPSQHGYDGEGRAAERTPLPPQTEHDAHANRKHPGSQIELLRLP
jgi:hypothetical protein